VNALLGAFVVVALILLDLVDSRGWNAEHPER
jgi:hypothetical protein